MGGCRSRPLLNSEPAQRKIRTHTPATASHRRRSTLVRRGSPASPSSPTTLNTPMPRIVA